MNRHILVLCLAAAVTACASTHGPKSAQGDPPVTPTQQFAVSLTHAPDEIRLAPHDKGLSPGQAAAVADLVSRWRESGDGPVTIQTPAGGGGDVFRGATAVQSALLRLGLPADGIRMVGYTADPAAGLSASGAAPIVVGFTRYEAHGPQCGRDWKDFTKDFANKPNSNFGCAVTANFAAMIANPADLVDPRQMDPSDANRRETIVGKYRKGDTTSSTQDKQASGAVSSVLQ